VILSKTKQFPFQAEFLAIIAASKNQERQRGEGHFFTCFSSFQVEHSNKNLSKDRNTKKKNSFHSFSLNTSNT
jgi:hypothetical protein